MYEKELFFLPESYVIKKYVHDKKIKSKTQVVHHYVDKENIYSIPRTLYELLQNWKKRSKDIFQFDTSPDALMFTTFGISPYVIVYCLNIQIKQHALWIFQDIHQQD